MTGRRGHKVPPLRRTDIRKTAMIVRDHFGLGHQAIDGERLLDRLTLLNLEYDVISYDASLQAGGIEAMWNPGANTIYIPDVTYNKLIQKDGRALFTVCHELGHVMLQHQVTQTLHRGSSAAPFSHKAYEDSEWQADTFAAEFCMPLPTIQAEGINWSRGIETRFGVSPTAATIRLRSLREEGVLQT